MMAIARYVIALRASALVLLLAACAPAPPKAALPPVTPIMIPPAMPAAQDLTGGTWHWEGPQGGAPVPRERYTLEFTGDGRVIVLADCNRGSSRYTQEAGGRLTLTPIASTKMACPDGSQDATFLRQLGTVEGFGFEGAALRLALRGGGTMRFVR